MNMDCIGKLLSHHELDRGESYCVYRLCPDGWPWGYNGSYRDADDVVSVYSMLKAYPDTVGIWITKESNDGTKEMTVFKTLRRVN